MFVVVHIVVADGVVAVVVSLSCGRRLGRCHAGGGWVPPPSRCRVHGAAVVVLVALEKKKMVKNFVKKPGMMRSGQAAAQIQENKTCAPNAEMRGNVLHAIRRLELNCQGRSESDV